MDRHNLSLDISSLSKTIRRYLTATMPQRAHMATGGNAHIIMFLARNRQRSIFQRDIEEHFCITRSTASRVLARMERKGLITRDSVADDARVKRIMLTSQADSIVEDLDVNAQRMEDHLLAGFSVDEKQRFASYLQRSRTNLDIAERRFDVHDTTMSTGRVHE